MFCYWGIENGECDVHRFGCGGIERHSSSDKYKSIVVSKNSNVNEAIKNMSTAPRRIHVMPCCKQN